MCVPNRSGGYRRNTVCPQRILNRPRKNKFLFHKWYEYTEPLPNPGFAAAPFFEWAPVFSYMVFSETGGNGYFLPVFGLQNSYTCNRKSHNRFFRPLHGIF